MSTCDTCREPGHCCKFLHLTLSKEWVEWIGESPLLALTAMAIQWLPFVPAAKNASDGDPMWACPILDSNGRCGDYENRPELCRHYQAHDDHLCIEFIGPKSYAPHEYKDFRAAS